jgi:WD40 repeat protein
MQARNDAIKRANEALLARSKELEQAKIALVREEEARNQAELANRRLYCVNMNLVQLYWANYKPRLFRQFLDEQLPQNQRGGTDRRGFEWFYWERKFRSGTTLVKHSGVVNCVTFNPEGTRLAEAGDDGTVRVCDVVTGSETRNLVGHIGAVSSVAFSPYGDRLASAGDDGTVRVWDLTTGREALPHMAHDGGVNVGPGVQS